MSDSQITKRALAEAMKELMQEKPMDKISVGEIVAKCGLNRKSFYYHFQDKYHLVNWTFYTEVFAKIKDQPSEDIWDTLSTVCEYLYANKVFYCNALRVSGQNCFSDYFMEVMQPVFKMYFESVFTENGERDFYAVYFTDATRAAITRWMLEDTPFPPARFIQLMRSATNGIAIRMSSDITDPRHQS